MTNADDIYFLADLHLAPERADVLDSLIRFLSGPGRSARAIYFLGDLFEAWIGDDDLPNAPGAQVAAALRSVTERGTWVGILRGNRDFLLGERFAQASGAVLLDDPYRLETAWGPLLLSHGDLFCTADTAYQEFRRQTRQKSWQDAFLARPLGERRSLATRLRAESEAQKPTKDSAVLDVSQAAVDACLMAYDCRLLIHGHTHRPDRHLWQIDGRPYERWVLADWSAERGDCLKLSDGVLSRLTL